MEGSSYYTLIVPLLTLFDPSKSIPTQVSAQIQKWALTIGAYEYIVQYKTTTDHGNADGLSRQPEA